MYQSKYYTCEEIDERLLKGYYDDVVSKGYQRTFDQFKLELASQDEVNLDILNNYTGYTYTEAIAKINELYPNISHPLTFVFLDKTFNRERRFKYKGEGLTSSQDSYIDDSNYVFTLGELNSAEGSTDIRPLIKEMGIMGFSGRAIITDNSRHCGQLTIFCDRIGHVVNQILITNNMLSEDGTTITTSPQHTPFQYERFFVVSGTGVDREGNTVGVGTNSKWYLSDYYLHKEVGDIIDNLTTAVHSFEDDDYDFLEDANTHVLTNSGNPIKPMTDFNSVFDDNGKSLNEYIGGIIYDVSAHNGGMVFESLSALLSSDNLNALIPTSVRCGGMSIRFVQGSVSNNKYVQYHYIGTAITGYPNPFIMAANWQGVDDEPTTGSDNLVKSGGVYKNKLAVTRTYNLINENDIKQGYYINNKGSIKAADGWAISHNIPVTPNVTYKIDILGTVGKNSGLAFFDSYGNTILYESSIEGVHTAPENAAYMVFNMMSNHISNTKVLVIDYTEGEYLPYIPYYILDDSEISTNIARVSQIPTIPVDSFEDDDYDFLEDANTHVLTNSGNPIKPMTDFNSVFDDNGKSLNESIRALEQQVGYYVCPSGNKENKEVYADNFTLLSISGGAIRIKFDSFNAIDSPTLNINNTGAFPLYYNGKPASLGNTWDDNDILYVYLDRTGESPIWQAIGLDKKLRSLQQSTLELVGYELKSELYQIASGDKFQTSFALQGLDIKANTNFEYMIVSNVSLSRAIINYNGSNKNRLVDNEYVITNTWISISSNVDITCLGFLYMGAGGDGTVGLYIREIKKFGSDRFEKKSIDLTLLSKEVTDMIIPCSKTLNLYNSLEKVWGKYVSTGTPPKINSAVGWAYSGYISVEADTDYYISAEKLEQTSGFSWCDSEKNFISDGGGVKILGLHHSPVNAAYMVFTVAKGGIEGRNIMVAKSNVPLPYVPYTQILISQVKGLEDNLSKVPVVNNRSLKLVKNGNTINITDGVRISVDTLERNADDYYSYNPVFNINGGDDIAPMHIMNETYGANHSVIAQKAKISSHGLDNTYVGTAWVKDTVTFYIMRIIDSDNIIFLSENNGSRSNPSFTRLTAGDITHDNLTLTISSVTTAQLFPGNKNHSVSIYGKNVGVISDDGTYNDEYFDIIESYDIMNPASTLEKIIARAGSSEDPIYDGDAAVHVENIYRYTKNMVVLVIVNIYALETVSLDNIMFSQANRKGDNGVVKYYVPNSLPFSRGAYDMRKPLAMNWSSSVNGINITSAYVKDSRYPINRVLQYLDDSGFALGFLTTQGIGANLNLYTDKYFELRNNTGKVYPHGISSKIGTTLQVGNVYSAVMYRVYFVPEKSGNRLSMYHFDYNGDEFVYIDYKGSIFDKVVVDDSLNGRKVEILESANTELKSNVYNGGFYVNATYVEGETCYLVAKITTN